MSFVGPFDVDAAIEHVRAHVPLAKIVGMAADLDAALESSPNAMPALYLLCEERGGEIKYTGPMLIQNVDVQLKVVLLVRNVREERLGVGARKLANQVITQIRAALLGWKPDSAMEGLHFTAGRDDRYKAGWYAGQQIFRTNYRIQKACQ